MNSTTSTKTDSVVHAEGLPERILMRHAERRLDYSISRFGTAMDHLAEKVNGTAQFIEKVHHVIETPKRGMNQFLANPDPVVRKTLITLAVVGAIQFFRRDYEIVSPFSSRF